MPKLSLYNANEGYDPFDLQLATIDYVEYNALPDSGTITINGQSFSCTKTVETGYTTYQYVGKLWWNSANWNAVKRALGLNTFRGDISNSLTNWYAGAVAELTDEDVALSSDDTTLIYPNFEVDYTPDGSAGGGDYFGTVNMSRSSGYTKNVGPFSLDDNGSTKNGIVGYMAVKTGDPEDAFGGYLFGLYCCQCWKQYGGDDPRMEITFITSSQITGNDFPDEFSTDPGDVGFHPAGNIAIRTIGGGNTSGSRVTYPTDTLTQPGAPDESVASATFASGFINVYKIDQANMEKIGKKLFASDFLSALENLAINPLDAIISVNIFPCAPDVGSLTFVKLLTNHGLVGDPSAYPLTKQFKVFDFGTLNVDEMFGSFLDYDASSFELYLPFIGSVDLPVGEVMGGSINVQYTVDFYTGMCVANVLCTKTMTDTSDQVIEQYVQHSYQGNCAVNVPITAVNYGSMIGSLINGCASGMTGGMVGAGLSMANSLASGGFRPDVQTKGSIGANAGFCAILYPYITITRPITAEPESYQDVMGYPSYVDSTLGEMSGLCICDNIDLRTITGATDSEIDEIMSICKSGIHV